MTQPVRDRSAYPRTPLAPPRGLRQLTIIRLGRAPPWQGLPRTARLDARLAGLLDRRLAVYEDYRDARLAGGAAGELVPDLRRHLAGHPFRERAWGALMCAQYRSGDLPGALASFAKLQVLLREQLGVDRATNWWSCTGRSWRATRG